VSQLSADDLDRRLAQVQLLLTDVDGVMTDGSVYVGENDEYKQFGIQDGLGLVILRRTGVKVGWLSARPSPATRRRGEELKLDFIVQQKGSKVASAEKILAEAGIDWGRLCYMGDDVVDLCMLKRAGVAIAVANAIDEAKAMAHYVTRHTGGHGAVREVVTMILKAQGKWNQIVSEFIE
jgi:3-deoxy-D-manno-octulosonate 8-phosphate phosphatase (KDO 8-P phosphatase)